MDDAKISQQIGSIRDEVGWVYPDLLWFSEEEAERANQERNELLEALSGWINYSFHGSKLHSGKLSPGCLICGNGGWGCNFINHLCSRNCFYCPQDHSIKKESEAQTDGMIFKDPSEHIRFLKIFRIQGVGFSGGEPLLVFDRLLSHIKAIRQEFGSSIYLWMYTNGDFVDRSSLRNLQEAGLDEIRFDISARNYDLTLVSLSKEYIPTVTVEIPAIPEDMDLLKGMLDEMETIGVDFLNLHQLYASKHNYKALRQRNYHFLHSPSVPIYESEICALKLLIFARKYDIHLPINYCCSTYKYRFQGRDVRTRLSKVMLKGFEEITSNGYIRLFKVLDSTDKIQSLIRRLEEAHCSDALWQCNDRKTEITVHSSLLSYLDWSSADIAILYFQPKIGMKKKEDGLVEGNLIPINKVVYEEYGWSQLAIECWHKLYIQKMDQNDVFSYCFQNYPLRVKDDIAKLEKEINELRKIGEWEQLDSGLPEVF
jgi:pyruvate formate-lyase activating enzyme-like uncharacterized protein